MRPRFAGSREVLARALLAIRRRALSLFNELLDFLPTFLSDAFVEVRAITIARGFAALLSTLLADLLVELMTVSLLGRQAALAADLFVELRAVLMLDRLAAFLAGFPDRHTTAAAVLFRNHLFYHLCRLCRPRRAASSLHLLQRTLRPESLGPRLVGDEKTRFGGGSRRHGGQNRRLVSSRIVTGPAFVSRTAICAPNSPKATATPHSARIVPVSS